MGWNAVSKKLKASRHKASDMRATIARNVWNDYRQRFLPIERQAIGMVGNQALKAEQMRQAGALATRGMASGAAIAADRLQGYGLQLTPAQQAGSARRSAVAGAAAKVGAINTAARAFEERDLKTLGTGGNRSFTR